MGNRWMRWVIFLTLLLLLAACGKAVADAPVGVIEPSTEHQLVAEDSPDSYDEDYDSFADMESDTFFYNDTDSDEPFNYDFDYDDDSEYEAYYDSDYIESEDKQAAESSETPSENPPPSYRSYSSIDELENTKHFNKHALEHIFYGQVNSRGKATGYHTESIPNKHGHIVSGTESEPDKNGVYEAKVEVNGKKKSGNNGRSTLYPKTWDAQQVVDAINEAYDNREFVKGSDNVYRGISGGITIEMYLTDNKKIISAFPVMGE